MADIRINSLPSTATSFNTDDYIAIDGASAGTRRMLAATLPLTDVTLGGASGPSVKSTLSARAPRQGLVFDGTSGTSIANSTAFGTNDFTVAAIVNGTSFATVPRIFGGASNSFALLVTSGGTLQSSLQSSADNTVSTGALTAGKNSLVVYVRSGTTGTYYIDGIAAGTTTDSRNYSAATTFLGATLSLTTVPWIGVIDGALIYNRALSASEVVALYEAGAPAGADYNSASNTALNTSSWTNPTYLYTSFTGVSATGFTAVKSGSGTAIAELAPAITGTKGQRIRVSVTLSLTSGAAPYLELMDAGYNTQSTASPSLSAGSNVIELTASGSFSRVCIRTLDATNYAVSSISVTRIGLLLAPDAAQAGGGLVWYDTSGNAANITLPASGVSWNVPFAGYIPTVKSPFLINGRSNGSSDLAVAHTTGNYGLNLITTGAGNTTLGLATSGGTTGVSLSASSGTASYIIGNLLVGASSPDGGQKLQVAGTVAFTGDLYSPTAGSTWGADSGATGFLVYGAGGGANANKLVLRTSSTAALTLDSSQHFKLTPAVASSIITTQSAPQIRMGSRATGRSNVVLDSTAGRVWSLENTGTSLTVGYSGLDALTIAETTGDATFAGTVTASTAGNYVLQLKDTRSQAADVGASIGLQGTYTGSLQTTFGSILGLKVNSTDGNFAGKLVFQTRPNGGSLTTALTLDDSQNATFAGNVTVSAGKYLRTPDVRDGTSTNDRLVHTSSTTAVFAGGSTWTNAALYAGGAQRLAVSATACSLDVPLKLNNAYQAGAPTATGYVTIQDSAGNTYKVLVGT